MMGVDIQIYRCRMGMYNCGLGPKLSDKSMVFLYVASGISTVSAVCFIGVLLVMAGIEPNPGPTGIHNSRNPLCKNWNKVAYGYRYVKTGLTRFISSQVGKRHTILKLHVHYQCHDVSPCSGCTFHTLLPDHGTHGCNQGKGSSCPCLEDPGTRMKCPNNFCGRFYHLIVDDHTENSPRWSSTDPTKWYNDFFQYAKCFLSTDSSANSVSDLDCTDLLTIVIHNMYIHNSVDEVKSFQQCLEDRNKIFHSGSFEVTDSELDNYIENMIGVLEDKTCLINYLDAQQAVKELIKLKNDLIEISDEDIDGLLNKIESDNTLIFRCQYLLIEIGTKVLRHMFDDRVGPNFGHYLVSTKDQNNKLEGDKLQDLIKRKRIITAAQAKFLPPIDINPSSANFDITLLTCLLRNVCGMRPSGDPEWSNPRSYSTEADITRLRICRNELAHSDTVFKSKTDLNAKWDELCRILNRLNHGLTANKITNLQSLINDSQHLFIDEKKQKGFNTIVEAWEKLDGDVIAVVEQCTDRIEQGMKIGFDSVQQTLIKEVKKPQMENETVDDAWTINEESVSNLLSRGTLPNAKQLKLICERFDSTSATVQKVCASICNTIQMTSRHVKRCWPAYVFDKHNDTDNNSVTFVAAKDTEHKLNIDQTFDYNIYELFNDSQSDESSKMIEYDIKNANKFNDEMRKIEKYVSKHSLSLMHSHSNITLIAGSTVKSIRYMFEKEIIENPCVVIYVHKKGYIPLGEKPFPNELDGFDTDVRECAVSLFGKDIAYVHHDNLLMGTSISNRRSTGTLGGFVEHIRYGLCGLTCAHVLCSSHLNGSDGVKHWSAIDPIIDVIQPATNEGSSIGKVVCALLRQDQPFGIDIALVSIEHRPPISGQFAIERTTDFRRNEYNSGNVMHLANVQRGADCIKFGSETGRTEAKLLFETSCFRIDSLILHNQLMVANGSKPDNFAAKGDSGALSFVETRDGLHAIGVVVGGNLNICFLTPLCEILDALNEGNSGHVMMKQFNVADNEPMQE